MSLVQSVKASSGKMFVLTAFGFEQKAPRSVFCNKSGLAKVPKKWIDSGYVTEVPVNTEE